MPIDWGAGIPLSFLAPGGRRHAVPGAVERPTTSARARRSRAATGDRPVAFVASADHGHGHTDDGPYGFSEHSAPYDDDDRPDSCARNALGELAGWDPQSPYDALADSLWQMLMLHGALGDGFRAELLSYEAPTYFGMLDRRVRAAGLSRAGEKCPRMARKRRAHRTSPKTPSRVKKTRTKRAEPHALAPPPGAGRARPGRPGRLPRRGALVRIQRRARSHLVDGRGGRGRLPGAAHPRAARRARRRAQRSSSTSGRSSSASPSRVIGLLLTLGDAHGGAVGDGARVARRDRPRHDRRDDPRRAARRSRACCS